MRVSEIRTLIELFALRFQHCGCVAFYMPRDPTNMPICSPEKSDCVHEAIVIVEETAFDDAHVTETNCQCLPSCTIIEYPHKYSAAKLTGYDLLHIPQKTLGAPVLTRL